MTKEEREVMRMALEALEDWDNWSDHTPKKTTEAIIAIDKCLANDAIEKKAENAREFGLDYEPDKNEFNPDWDEKLALTEEVIRLSKRIEELEAQPEQEPVAWRYRMPVEDGHFVWNYATYIDDPKDQRCDPLYTTPPQRKPEQEPVCDKDPQGCWNVRCQLGKKCKNTPLQRTWVGLTKKEFQEAVEGLEDLEDCCVAIEAKLRSKND